MRWLALALEDFTEIARYHRQEAPAFERKILLAIYQGIDTLAEYPWKGRLMGTRDTRRLVILNTNYVVTYRVKREVVEIVRIRHGAQKPLIGG